MAIHLKSGDYIRLRLCSPELTQEAEWHPAVVLLASPIDRIPQSILLSVPEGARGQHKFIGGLLPLTVDYLQEKVCSLFGDEYEVEVAGEI